MRSEVLFVCEGIQHLTVGNFLADKLKKIGIESSLFYPHHIDGTNHYAVFKNISNDILTIPGFLQKIGLIIFFTLESSPFCMCSNKISFIAKKTKTNAITLQHGWIQPGFNFETSRERIAFLGRNTDNSKALWHFSDVIPFFGEQGIGFPHIENDESRFIFPSKPKFNILLATNFNWGVYSKENIIFFLRSLLALKRKFPSINISHKPHPAENIQTITSELGFYLDLLDISKSSSFDTIDSALLWADVVISTPSTAVIDSLVKKIPVFVFSCELFKNSLVDFESISFDSPEKLCELMGLLLVENIYHAPIIPYFKDQRFFDIVKERIAHCEEYFLDEEAFLTFIGYAKS